MKLVVKALCKCGGGVGLEMEIWAGSWPDIRTISEHPDFDSDTSTTHLVLLEPLSKDIHHLLWC